MSKLPLSKSRPTTLRIWMHTKSKLSWMKRGVVLNPIAVYRRDGEDKWSISNGFHRIKAHQILGRSEIEVDVIGAPIPPGARSGRPLQ
jgi:ParB/Sulfiredoxin domain